MDSNGVVVTSALRFDSRKESGMNLSAPTTVVFIISVLIALVALLMFLNVIAFAALAPFWVMTIAWVVLAAGCLLKGI